MKKAVKTTLAVVAGATAVAGVASIPAIVSAWGDSAGGRPTYSVQEINEKMSDFGNTPLFNSIEIKDSDYDWYKANFGEELKKGNLRHEKNFVGARENTGVNAGPNNVWDGNNITAEDGKTYLVRLYAHNNNSNSVAENTTVRFQDANNVASTLETVKLEDENGYETGETKQMQQVQINGFITSSNANPNEYWDYVNFNADVPFHLEYVYGSALLENNGAAAGKLSDDIITNGTLIGYDALDGKVPGCYQYANYVSIQVKVVYDYDFTIEKKVRLAGEKEWKESVDAKVGDKVEFQIKYTNTSDKQQDNVVIKDILPSNLRYVAGSTKIKNSNHPNGDTLDHDYLVTDGQKVGNYGPGANVRLMFTAEVVDDNLACGKNTLVNWAQAGVGDTTIQDEARVVLAKTCDTTPETPKTGETTPTALPTTGPEAVAGGVIATGAIVTAAGYYIASRRQLR